MGKEVLFLDELKSVRNKNTAIFLGCGPSIKDLNSSLVDKISKLDIWASNNFLLNEDITSDFHHMEIIEGRNGPLFDTLKRVRKDSYKDITWLMDKKVMNSIEQYLHPNWKNKIYLYNKIFRHSNNGLYKPTLDDNCQLSCSTPECHANLTVIMDMMYKVGYKKVYFLGVDLYTSSYFWTVDERYEKYNIPKTMYVEEGVKHNGKHFHSTHKTANFIKEFSEHNNIEVVNLSKDSLLKDFIPTITYDEFLKENI